MNVQSIVLLMAVMAVGSMGAASQAFADHHSGDASTRRYTRYQESPMVIHLIMTLQL